MPDQMTVEEAANALATGRMADDEDTLPNAKHPLQEIPDAPEPSDLPEKDKKPEPPKRVFTWIDEESLTVEDWIAGQAHAVLQVVPGMVIQFREPKELERDEVDALVNGIGPAFIMKGLRDGVMATQVRRASNIGLLCQAITHINGERWLPGSSLEDRWKWIKGKGSLMIDRLIEAFYEFTNALLWKIENGDLGNS